MAIIPKEEWSKLHIAKLSGWTLSVCGDQHVLGWLIIFPPRKVEGALTQLTDQELLEFKKIGIIAEDLLKEAFNAEWFNYSQAGNVVKNLHIHLQPRYSSERNFEGYKFTDEGWGHPVEYLASEELASKELVFSITKHLRSILKTQTIPEFTVEIATT